MWLKCHSQGKFYTIECPEVVRISGSVDHFIVPLNGTMIRIPADPPELLPMPAETGNIGV